ncbi:MAG TPA: hypothetical protein VK149_10365 [Sideroxyarcus sp.]|nr:hypothetical protein [Sideroxyarcus sp.]
MSVSSNPGETSSAVERRTRYHLREIFDQAYEAVLPMLDPEQGIHPAGSQHFIRIVLHDKFPDLHQQDIAILSVSIERVFRERSKPESQ